ncbi:hypothetical protein FNV43_RR01677 [Rhamnella rubrinervis]|uniref:3'-5' exonuclease domain-containing protein n=1 Tax=Rhamnella rubrinervis TaxID=2594499 RepID=A0A8K0HSM5_9ROSA|nr:hypothetical protein FNV43_RR01677 [Rhamnella rubrinervis]
MLTPSGNLWFTFLPMQSSLSLELIGKGMEKPKHVTLSDWDTKKFSYEQIEYASIDAYFSFELGMFLTDHNRPRRSPNLLQVLDHHFAASHHYLARDRCVLDRPVFVYHAPPTLQFAPIS